MCRVFCCVEFKGTNTEQNPRPEAMVASALLDTVDPGLPLTGRGALRRSWAVLVTGGLIRGAKEGESCSSSRARAQGGTDHMLGGWMREMDNRAQ